MTELKFDVELVEKYGREVWAHKEMDTLRRDHCLCLNCLYLYLECPAAAALYRACKDHDLALAVTRCPEFEKRKEA